MIPNAADRAIVETVLAGGKVTADSSLGPDTNYIGIYNSLGATPSTFTSCGSTFDLAISLKSLRPAATTARPAALAWRLHTSPASLPCILTSAAAGASTGLTSLVDFRRGSRTQERRSSTRTATETSSAAPPCRMRLSLRPSSPMRPRQIMRHVSRTLSS